MKNYGEWRWGTSTRTIGIILNLRRTRHTVSKINRQTVKSRYCSINDKYFIPSHGGAFASNRKTQQAKSDQEILYKRPHYTTKAMLIKSLGLSIGF